MDDARFRLGDPDLAVQLLGTLWQDVDVLVDELEDPDDASAWLADHGLHALDQGALGELRNFRDQLRALFTAITAGEPPASTLVAALNEVAARDPVTLQATRTDHGTVQVERVGTSGAGCVAVLAELARAALALLAERTCGDLRLCDAPNCVRFFLKQNPRQQWCTPACGNRARVARHYARHHPR